MRRRSRDISTINVSMLDVLAGALGIVLILLLIAMPYYRKESIEFQEDVTELQAQLAQEQQARQDAEAERQKAEAAKEAAEAAQAEAERRLEQARQEAATSQGEALSFLMIVASWSASRHDIDLIVVDPSGAKFTHEARSQPGRRGRLGEDARIGPGTEIWEAENPQPGPYKVSYWYRGDLGGPQEPTIEGYVYSSRARLKLPTKTLDNSYVTREVPVATITVGRDGTVTIVR